MSKSALLMMVTSQTVIVLITLYFFWRAMTAPPRPEPDSYVDNDDDPR